ncbi:T9SS type A sorting domain-containing protein [uncultured Winogradskyella sp.]|uniref:T9SS type A sorting domain-containing protein n=1 Tax=uncultured Winogradskyella sp. TaxID=395353 RepID=UPI00262E9F39|nr:T9SS type A sorting domain-containing protein [uncultured Winogradskyella sp.]
MMKSIICVLIFFSFSVSQSQTTAIPDTSFENYLETHDENGNSVTIGDASSMGDGIANNGLVFTNRISGVTFLDVSNLSIAELSGIEDFSALEALICSDNNLSELDISNNLSLVSLLCGINRLTDLSLANNTSLETLNCSDNQLQTIDVSNNINLKSLTVSGNQLSGINVESNNALTSLSVSNNRIIGELLVSNNLDLESLFCSSNLISTLDLTANTVLKNLDASNNRITDLDLSSINTVVCPDPQTDPITLCQGTSTINVSRNELTSLIVNNGYNDLIAIFNASDNPDLFCIQIDSGFTPNGWIKDDWAYYTDGVCADIYTYVPDDNFEQALINLGYDDMLDNLVLTSNIDSLMTLDISNQGISDATGIEDFLALSILIADNNSINEINILPNTALTELYLSNNNLSQLDTSSNLNIDFLNISNNQISNLDLSNNNQLTILNCSGNSLLNLNLQFNTLLDVLDCSNNLIESLNLSVNSVLSTVLCNDNNLFSLEIDNSNNTAITTFNATSNSSLFCIKVDDIAFSDTAPGWQKDAAASYNTQCGTYIPDDNFEQALIDQGIDSDNTLNNFVPTADIDMLTMLDVSGLAIEDLTGIEDFIALQDLNCSNNILSVINLDTNLALVTLDISGNSIGTLNVTLNTNLTSLLCNNNSLTELDIKNGNNNLLANFNATNNPNLFCINVDDTIIGNIPLAWQIDATANYNNDCDNNRFTLIPDIFFEEALIDLGFDAIVDGQVLTANIEQLQNLDVSDSGISNLTGIQDFKSLVELDCSGNFLNDLDVNDLLFLERLNCSSNNIDDLNGIFGISGALSLTELYCAGNNFANIDISQNTSLEVLDCSDNKLINLDLSNNALLRILNTSNNLLSNLDISALPVLEDVNCDSNRIDNLTTSTVLNNTLTKLSCANNNLSNLQLVNYQDLVSLNCRSNELSQLEINGLNSLEFLDFTSNQITNIDLSTNTNVLAILASQNNLSSLVLILNTSLEELNCNVNDIAQLDLTTNTALKFLSCSNNELSSLNLSSNVNLIEADFNSNLITTIVLSNNLGTLKTLNANNNQIEGDLDLTTMSISACPFQPSQPQDCPENITINLSNNQLEFINLQNGINSDITNFNATNNPNLDCIQVDDANNIPIGWLKDATTSYNTDCNFGETFVPDDNFEQALIDLGLDSGPLNDYVPTANIETLLTLDVSGNNIADLTGIEDFEALEDLNCSSNAIDSIDLSSNINLITLNASNNQLSTINTTNNLALTTLNCSSNSIASIDLTQNTNLAVLDISNNVFTSFLPSEILSLSDFICDGNAIVELDFQLNQNVTNLSCQSNSLEVLNIKNGQNAILVNLNTQNNPDLTCIETDNGTVPAGVTWLVDATTQFSTECFFGETFVPDDNLEQALIDLGYDTEPLDDYVPTTNIESVTFLNISSREISDLTGIEDFVSLVNLNFEINNVSSVDLSNNLVLTNLDASNNNITDIDLTSLTGLTSLDISDNGLTTLNLDTNSDLVNLDVANNSLNALNVDILTNLEELNCSSNLISSLSFTQNVNLEILFCQSNILVGDQLNLQNGNNENLQIFNAINNPDLGCILVDDPVAVISNVNGTYDNWDKDDTATYQTICEDADNDGVPNTEDLCPGTEFGVPVDLFGCPFPGLANDNFAISILSETCLNSNDGQITIVSQETYSYMVTLTGEDFFQEYNFINDIDILNLLAGTYEMCITIEEWPAYQTCYTIVITEPNPLEVFASRVASGNRIVVEMSGSTSYNFVFNDETFTTHNSSITLDLKEGANTLKVSTDLECQGIFSEIIFNTKDFVISPNPFNDVINIDNVNEEEISVNVHSIIGKLILNEKHTGETQNIRINTSSFDSGIYIISVTSKTRISTYKIIKQ